MKAIYEPSVYLAGFTKMNDTGVEDFLEAHEITTWVPGIGGKCSDGESVIEVGGRLCYMSFEKPRPGGNEAYIRHIKEVGHGSVLEHATFNLIFTGVSRTLTHELVRHRVGMSYSQLSQRYVDESVAEYVVPHDLRDEVQAAVTYEKWMDNYEDTGRGDAFSREAKESYVFLYPNADMVNVEAGCTWIRTMRQASSAYRKLTDHLKTKIEDKDYESFRTNPANSGVTKDEWFKSRPVDYRTAVRKAARQAARSVLPNATETKIMVTANTRSLRHFIELRASRHAEPEIRKLAHAVWKKLVEHSPNSFGDYTETPLPDGTYELTTQNKKV